MLPAIVLLLFCIFMQLAVITLILSKNISSDSRPAVIFITILFGVLALWQTIEVWNVGTSSPFGY